MRSIYIFLALLSLTKAQISVVQNVKLTPIQYKESDSVTVTWDVPKDLGSFKEADLTYGVESCAISTTNCKSYGNVTTRSVAMTDFARDRGQIYTYHIRAYSKDGTKGEEKKDLLKFEKRDTCRKGFFACESSNQCEEEDRKCDGIQGCSDNSDETAFAGCLPPPRTDAVVFDKIGETSITILFQPVHPKERPTKYSFEVIEKATDKIFTRKNVYAIKYEQKERAVTFDGLTPGTEYNFRFAAVNAVGTGIFSDDVTLKTDGVAPATTTTTAAPVSDIPKVTNVKVTPKVLSESTAVIITWDEPSEKADQVDKYEVTYCEINMADTCKKGTETGTRKVEITGLDNQKFYTLHIKAIGKDGKAGADFSDPFQPAKKRTCSSDQFTCTKVDSCIAKDRICNTLVDCADKSDEGTDANCPLPKNVPGDVKVVMVKSTGFTVSFEQVAASDRAEEYDVYVVDTKTDKGITKKISHEAFGRPIKEVKIEGLTVDTEYKIRVRARNAVGDGQWSADVITRTENFGPVLNVKLTPVEFFESSSFVISWQRPLNFDKSIVFSYQVIYCRINLKDTCKTTEKTTGHDQVIKGLNREDIYEWEIKIFDSEGAEGKSIKDTYKTKPRDECTSDQFRCTGSPQCVDKNNLCNAIKDCGDASDEKVGAQCKVPSSRPKEIDVKEKSQGSYKFTFPNFPGADRIDHFEIEVRDIRKDEVFLSSSKQHNYLAGAVVEFQLDGLVTGKEYEVRFRGVNPSGDGPWSEPISVGQSVPPLTRSTTKAPPSSDESSEGMTTAQKAGIAIGIILALIILIIIIVIVMKNRKSKSSKPQGKYNGSGKPNNGYEMDRRP
ncbi:receptor-type tyrosine-protein phosphatase F-like [Clytia hemisphaerica]|uniref:Fibronectin type-III domain-containing protein n=1 Tax=Clytia hemisphaerica TaxID=252671 RepID=A0A7M5V3V5_9CNID